MDEELQWSRTGRSKSPAEGRTMLELQREIDDLRAKVGQLEEVNNLILLAHNRLDEFNEVMQNYTTLLARQLVIEMSASRMKKVGKSKTSI